MFEQTIKYNSSKKLTVLCNVDFFKILIIVLKVFSL